MHYSQNTITCMGDYRRGLDVDSLYYAHDSEVLNSATANLNTSQIITLLAKPFSTLLCLHQPFPANGF
jgi:hypothetical protein